MKYCSQCGMEQRDDAAYCIRCGAPCTDAGSSVQDDTGKSDSAAVRAKLQKKLIYILPAVVLAVVLLYVLYSPARRSCQLVMDGRTEQAGELYRKRVEGNKMEAFFLRLLVPRSASAIFNAYTEEKIGYDEALERLKTLASGVRLQIEAGSGAGERIRQRGGLPFSHTFLQDGGRDR